ncbi:982_t:CDS:2, partial [Gigaspora rosea]
NIENFSEEKRSCNECLERARTNSKRRYEKENEKKIFNSKENSIPSSNLTQAIYDSLISIPELDENLEGDAGFFFEYCVDFTDLLDFQESSDLSESSIANKLIEKVQAGDGCNCRIDTVKKSRKHLDKEKQRDTVPRLNRYDCNGNVSIKVDNKSNLAVIKINHQLLHTRPENITTTNEIKEFITNNLDYTASELYKKIVINEMDGFKTLTTDQVYYWWSKANIIRYKRHDSESLSAQLLLQEKNYLFLFRSLEPVDSFAFLTPFFSFLPKMAYECLLVDATYNTNKLKYELYVLMATIDYTGFPVSYLYIASNKNRDMRSILTKWFLCLRNHGVNNIKTFLSDKDFAQISSAQAVWKDVNIQLCKWHVSRAIKQKLSSSKTSSNISYDATEANHQCSFIDPAWINTRNVQSSNQKTNSKVFCVQFYRNIILDLVEKHLRQHMLLPTNNKEFINDPQQIRALAIKEMFEFCYTNDLFDVWCYLWNEWYRDSRWKLWATSSNSEISPLLTTMI